MNARDEFDELIAARLRAAAPQEAPIHLMDTVMTRLASTAQRRRGPFAWLASPPVRLAAVAAVAAAALVVGTQFGGWFSRPIGTDSSPSVSPSAAPEVPPAESESHSPSESPSADSSPEAELGDPSELVLRLETACDTTSPEGLVADASLMADGTMIWLAIDPATGGSLLSRPLTADGLADMREAIFGDGLLDESATYELERRPDAGEPPGRGVCVHTFTAENGGVVVTSVGWLGDEMESTYYEPSPEREALDAFANALREPETLVGRGGRAGPAGEYEAPDYQLTLAPTRDVGTFGSSLDYSEVPWPFDGPPDAYGEPEGIPGGRALRCGVISPENAVAIVIAIARAGGYTNVDIDRAWSATLGWEEGNGMVEVFMIPRMPDGYPECDVHS